MAKAHLSSAQQAQVVYLRTLPPKFERIHRLVEEIANLHGGETTVKSLCRMLDELRHGASTVVLTPIADTLGMMGMIARRGGGGLPMKVRALREGLASLKVNYEGLLRTASTPVEAPREGEGLATKAATPPAPSP